MVFYAKLMRNVNHFYLVYLQRILKLYLPDRFPETKVSHPTQHESNYCSLSSNFGFIVNKRVIRQSVSISSYGLVEVWWAQDSLMEFNRLGHAHLNSRFSGSHSIKNPKKSRIPYSMPIVSAQKLINHARWRGYLSATSTDRKCRGMVTQRSISDNAATATVNWLLAPMRNRKGFNVSKHKIYKPFVVLKADLRESQTFDVFSSKSWKLNLFLLGYICRILASWTFSTRLSNCFCDGVATSWELKTIDCTHDSFRALLLLLRADKTEKMMP